MRESVLEIYKWMAILGFGTVFIYVVGGLLIDAVKAENKRLEKINKKSIARQKYLEARK